MTLDPLLAAPAVIQIHAAAALLAIPLGLGAWLRRPRDGWHRALGYAWVVAMMLAALSAAFIFTIHLIGPFSPIHALVPVVLYALWRGVRFARAGRIGAHRATMTALYVQALGIAGLFTLLPGRIMGRVLFPEAPWAGFAAAALLLVAGLALWTVRMRRPVSEGATPPRGA